MSPGNLHVVKTVLGGMRFPEVNVAGNLRRYDPCVMMKFVLAIDPVGVERRIQALLDEANITVAPMDAGTAHLAVMAFAEYGKGRGHPAQLNLADCLSYACAKAQGIPLLYKGRDFSHTDLG